MQADTKNLRQLNTIFTLRVADDLKNDRVVEWENLGDAVQEGDGIGIGSLAIVANFLSTSL